MAAGSLAIATMALTLTLASTRDAAVTQRTAAGVFRLPTEVTTLAQSRLPVFRQRSVIRNRTAVRITAVAAASFGGFLVGGTIGSTLDRHCVCDDPGLRGFIIAAPIGAIAAGIATAIYVK
jgi:hypothetical protein